MQLGLIFSGGGTSMAQMVSLSVEAEAAGLDCIYVTEAWRSAFVTLAAIAAATKRVEIGSYILNAYARSVWITAMSAVDLDELSQGRLVLGVGGGNKHINEQWQGIPHDKPLKKMTEYVPLLRKAVSTRLGEMLDYEGEMHRMHWAPTVAPFRSTIPIFLAALYPKMIAVAGRVADGIAMGALLSPAYIREVVFPQFHNAASTAGRDPKLLRSSVSPFVSVGDDAAGARQAAREAICRLYSPLPHPYYDFILREQGFSQAADAAAKWVPLGKIEKAAEAFTDDIVDAITISGTFEQCKRKLADYDDVVDQLLFVNVNYSSTSEDATLRAFQNLIKLGTKKVA